MKQLASTIPERIILRVDPAKKKAFLEMLKLFDFVEVETLEAQVKRYAKNAPANVPLADDDIMQEIQAVRKQRKHL